MVTRTINGGSAMSSPVVGSRNVLKRNSIRFAALLAALASFVGGPNEALAAAPQHHDQVPGFYRLRVGDLEVTALYDGTGVFDPHWLNGTKAPMMVLKRHSTKIRTCWMLLIRVSWSTPASN